jgi:hypothetical protein
MTERPRVVDEDLGAAYARMTSDKARETEAVDWCDALIPDAADERIEEDRSDRG